MRCLIGDPNTATTILRGEQESASTNATGLEVIEEPRSAWMVNWSRPMPCLAQVWRISNSARAADSRVATVHPTPWRDKMSKITYGYYQLHFAGPRSLVISHDTRNSVGKQPVPALR